MRSPTLNRKTLSSAILPAGIFLVSRLTTISLSLLFYDLNHQNHFLLFHRSAVIPPEEVGENPDNYGCSSSTDRNSTNWTNDIFPKRQRERNSRINRESIDFWAIQ